MKKLFIVFFFTISLFLYSGNLNQTFAFQLKLPNGKFVEIPDNAVATPTKGQPQHIWYSWTDAQGYHRVCTNGAMELIPPPVCGAKCVPEANNCPLDCSVCAKKSSGSDSYTCKPGPSATPTPTTQPSPTPPPACGVVCTIPTDCSAAQDGCTTCSGGVCTIPPTSTPTPSPTPVPSSTPTPSPTPIPTSTPIPPTPTPTPNPFQAAMCKCDGIDIEPKEFATGKKLVITAYAKVEGTDLNYATLDRMLFSSGKGVDPNIKRDVPFDVPVAVTIVEQTPTKIRYKSVWEYTVPGTLDPRLTYRIWSEPECKQKTAMSSGNRTANAPGRVVLAATSENKGLLAGIFDFFSNLFGIGKSTEQNLGQNVTPTIATEKPLTLGTFGFGKVTETDNCRYIKFKMDKM